MPTNAQCESHQWMLEQLQKAQKADHDRREMAREANNFIDAPHGHWEQYWWDINDNQPRYQFDLTTPMLEQITGQIEKQDFSTRVIPGGGNATKEISQIYDGLIRNIENISNAEETYDGATELVAIGGLDGWRVDQQYVEGDSFDQDLVVKDVPNYIDRVWHGPHEKADASDAKICWVLSGLDPDEYKEKYPNGTAHAVPNDRTGHAYFYRKDLIMVGEFLYLKGEDRELVKLDDGRVFVNDEDYQKIRDEILGLGFKEIETRKRKLFTVYSRLFDGSDWLSDPRKTVFQNWIPVIPCYANFKVIEDKIIYRGAVEKQMDPQRVFDYSLSREVSEGALAPRSKYWMTEEQSEGHEDELSELNTSADPVQHYNNDPEVPGPPQMSGGAQINPGLRIISEAMQGVMGQIQGMYHASMGDNPNAQSGVAIEALQDRGDTSNNRYIKARKRAQRHTGRILVDAIPRVYTPGRQIRLLNEDGTHETRVLGMQVQDGQSGEVVTINELSEGTYDVTCTAGPSFENRQNETVSNMIELSRVDPSIIEIGGDVLLSNMNSPGMNKVGDRKRRRLFEVGAIPEEEWTEEERALAEKKRNQGPQEDPNMVLAKAEEGKAMADLKREETNQFKTQADIEIRKTELALKAEELENKRFELMIKAQESGVNIEFTEAKIMGQEIDNISRIVGV